MLICCLPLQYKLFQSFLILELWSRLSETTETNGTAIGANEDELQLRIFLRSEVNKAGGFLQGAPNYTEQLKSKLEELGNIKQCVVQTQLVLKYCGN